MSRRRMHLVPRAAALRSLVVAAATLLALPLHAQLPSGWCGTAAPLSLGGPGGQTGPACAACSQQNCSASPCLAKTGNYVSSATDLSLPAAGPGITIGR